METTGQITNITQTFPARETMVTIKVAAAPAEVEKLKDKELTIGLKRYRKKRTTDSNAFYWLLVGKLASHDRISRTEMHNRLLKEYGQESIIDGAFEWSVKPRDFKWERSEECHYKPTGKQVKLAKDGTLLDIYWVIRGSHTYNTEEMSILINGTIEECKERGIETMTPEELQRMFAAEESYAGNAKHKDWGTGHSGRQGKAARYLPEREGAGLHDRQDAGI